MGIPYIRLIAYEKGMNSINFTVSNCRSGAFQRGKVGRMIYPQEFRP